MQSEKSIRPCGSDFVYCGGDCINCNINKQTTSTSTSNSVQYNAFKEDDGISKPTQEMYMKSLEAKKSLADWIRRSRKRQEELMDELLKERTNEKDYKSMYEAHHDLVRRFELYEEIEAANG